MAATTVKPGVMRSRVTAQLPDRWTGQFANPVGNTSGITRETRPVTASSTARTRHPKLNATPWSTSYAQKRTPLSESKSKGTRAM
jgi:hypothetical protein